MAKPYGDVLVDNFKALRGRAKLDHARLAERMRDLGYKWNRSTVSKIERKERALQAAEMVALAACLETSVQRLMSPLLEDDGIEFRSGLLPLRVATVEGYVTGEWVTDERIMWLDDKAVLNPRPGRIEA